jgi:two-component system, LytTR family, sensor kinase
MKKKYIIGLHILVWSLLLIEATIGLIDIPKIESPFGSLSRELYIGGISFLYLTLSMVTFYGIVFWVLPLFFRKKSYLWGVLSVVALVLMLPFLRYLLEFGFLKPFMKWDNYNMNTHFTWTWFVTNCLGFYFRTVIWGVIYFFIVEWYQTTTREKTLEREKIHAELAFLKSQINPHFLFNTINDIYALACTKSDDTPDALLKLSGILRYMLHESNNALVPLEKELDYIKEFIDLQNIGFKGNTHILFFTTPTYRDEAEGFKGGIDRVSIAPMLLIPFVENAFKHGYFTDKDKPIDIHCSVENGRILFTCKNAVRKQQKDKIGGIGLQNVQRRLVLLYPERHQLTIEEKDGWFNCTLILHTLSPKTI